MMTSKIVQAFNGETGEPNPSDPESTIRIAELLPESLDRVSRILDKLANDS